MENEANSNECVFSRVFVRECVGEGARVGVCVCEYAGYVFVCWKNSLEVK